MVPVWQLQNPWNFQGDSDNVKVVPILGQKPRSEDFNKTGLVTFPKEIKQ
jgi:hypothetical protein